MSQFEYGLFFGFLMGDAVMLLAFAFIAQAFHERARVDNQRPS